LFTHSVCFTEQGFGAAKAKRLFLLPTDMSYQPELLRDVGRSADDDDRWQLVPVASAIDILNSAGFKSPEQVASVIACLAATADCIAYQGDVEELVNNRAFQVLEQAFKSSNSDIQAAADRTLAVCAANGTDYVNDMCSRL
jgi:hypothetical protein